MWKGQLYMMRFLVKVNAGYVRERATGVEKGSAPKRAICTWFKQRFLINSERNKIDIRFGKEHCVFKETHDVRILRYSTDPLPRLPLHVFPISSSRYSFAPHLLHFEWIENEQLFQFTSLSSNEPLTFWFPSRYLRRRHRWSYFNQVLISRSYYRKLPQCFPRLWILYCTRRLFLRTATHPTASYISPSIYTLILACSLTWRQRNIHGIVCGMK